MTAATSRAVRTIDTGSYLVRIEPGLREQFAQHIVSVAPAHRFAIVTDAHVGPLYADALAASLAPHGRVSVHVIPAGEGFKTRETWVRVTDELLAAGCARDTTVVALGGGVVGDLAGFVAATFMRGVPVVQCPTTLLAMIDASIGGKTGVDTSSGKNLVGAFHAPAAVLADPDVLRTLPVTHRRAGLAEAFKHGIIADADYLSALDERAGAIIAGDAGATLDAVARSVEIKAAVVSADAREHGLRKTLNFGHTLGHAIEYVSGYALLHGECVAIGMVLEARIAELLGVADSGTAVEIEQVLLRAGLPVSRPPSVSALDVIAATRLDKKSRGGAVEYALPARIGTMADNGQTWSIGVDDASVREVLR